MIGITEGDLAQWVSGMATFLAVVVALIFSLRQDRRADEEARAKVHVWTVHERGEWQLVISNRTSYPIYRWKVTLNWSVGPKKFEDHVSQEDEGIIPPGEFRYAWTPEDMARATVDASVSAQIDFTDHRGKNWRRQTSGELKNLRSPSL